MSNANTIGEKLVALCKEGQNAAAIQELYADDCESIEAAAGPGAEREMKGKEAILGKNAWWTENHEVHASSVKGPFPHGEDKFAVLFDYDVTFKPESRRMQMEEVGVYRVANGKVVREEFFYKMG